jgi:hypothetical protein
MADVITREEKVETLEKVDKWAEMRQSLKAIAKEASVWAGFPMPLQGASMNVHPKYPAAAILAEHVKDPEAATEEPADIDGWKVRNEFWIRGHTIKVGLLERPDGKVVAAYSNRAGARLHMEMETMVCSVAWGIEQEANALQLLAELLPHAQFKRYLLTGMFTEQSARSGVFYIFRKLRPTLALKAQADNTVKALAALCMHPIAHYSGTWAGGMCPSDDVVAHLTMMRGDEKFYWRKCNQHPISAPEAGL